jgi:CheY-like chemotaxis protein
VPIEQQAVLEIMGTPARCKTDTCIRVLLADDHKIVREGLAALLNEQEDIEVVGQATNGREAVDLAHELEPDVVVMDVAMPMMKGDEATRQIKQRMPKARVIGLSMFDEPGLVERMRQAGAEQYVAKTAPAEELLAAIRDKYGGQPSGWRRSALSSGRIGFASCFRNDSACSQMIPARPSAGTKSVYRFAGYQRREEQLGQVSDSSAGIPSCRHLSGNPLPFLRVSSTDSHRFHQAPWAPDSPTHGSPRRTFAGKRWLPLYRRWGSHGVPAPCYRKEME